MLAWRQTAGLLMAPMLFGADAALQAWQPETGPPQLEAVPVPDDPADFDCAWGTEERLALLEKLNRCDRDRLPKLDKIVIPLDWDRDEADYSPLPKNLAWAENLDSVVRGSRADAGVRRVRTWRACPLGAD